MLSVAGVCDVERRERERMLNGAGRRRWATKTERSFSLGLIAIVQCCPP